MAKQKRSVMILFNGLTTNNKVYSKGEIEDNPNDYLIKVATDRVKQYHRDEGKEVRLARFIKSSNSEYEEFSDFDDFFEDNVVRSPVMEESDDLDDMEMKELIITARALGLKKDIANTLSSDQLISFSRFMRKL